MGSSQRSKKCQSHPGNFGTAGLGEGQWGSKERLKLEKVYSWSSLKIQWIATSHSPQSHDPGRLLPHHKILEAYSLQESKAQGLWGWKYSKSVDTILKTQDISDCAQECWLLQSRVSFQRALAVRALVGLWARTS